MDQLVFLFYVFGSDILSFQGTFPSRCETVGEDEQNTDWGELMDWYPLQ